MAQGLSNAVWMAPAWRTPEFRADEVLPMRMMKFMFAIALGLSPLGSGALAQTRVEPGFNLFSAQQDVEIGRASAVQVEQQVPIATSPAASRLVQRIGARLAAQAPGTRFPYQFKVVNLSDLNAFALPGGYVYINRGLIERVRSEGELAGVMAHEIAHVALRHPTSQLTKAYAARAGAGLVQSLLGGGTDNRSGQIVNALGGFGLNTLFLRFSRSAEQQADVVGAQIMSRAGYDPREMVKFFQMMRQQQGGNPGAVARFFSDHPSPADREARVAYEASMLGRPRRASSVGGLASAQAELRGLPRAPTMAQVAAR
jgi:predicted Zn-dependent protease